MRADMRRSAAKRLEEAVLRELGTLSRGVDEGVLTRDEGRLIGVIVESVRILRRKIEVHAMTAAVSYVRRGRLPVVHVEVAPSRAQESVVGKRRGWANLRGEVLGTFKQLGVVDVEAGRRTPT